MLQAKHKTLFGIVTEKQYFMKTEKSQGIRDNIYSLRNNLSLKSFTKVLEKK